MNHKAGADDSHGRKKIKIEKGVTITESAA